VSAIGVGGWHLALKHVDEPLAIRILRSAFGEEPQEVQELMPA